METKTIEEIEKMRVAVITELHRLCPQNGSAYEGGCFSIAAYKWTKGMHYKVTIAGYGDNVIYEDDLPEYMVETMWVVLGLEAAHAVEAERGRLSPIVKHEKDIPEILAYIKCDQLHSEKLVADTLQRLKDSEARAAKLVEVVELSLKSLYAAIPRPLDRIGNDNHICNIADAIDRAIESHKKGGNEA